MHNESGGNSWVGIRVRKGTVAGENEGVVIRDMNGPAMRVLYIQMDNGTAEKLTMNNIGPDPDGNSVWWWFWDKNEPHKWYQF